MVNVKTRLGANFGFRKKLSNAYQFDKIKMLESLNYFELSQRKIQLKGKCCDKQEEGYVGYEVELL